MLAYAFLLLAASLAVLVESRRTDQRTSERLNDLVDEERDNR